MNFTQWLARRYRATEGEALALLRVRSVIEQLAFDEEFWRGLHCLSAHRRDAYGSRAIIEKDAQPALFAKAEEAGELPQILLNWVNWIGQMEEQHLAECAPDRPAPKSLKEE